MNSQRRVTLRDVAKAADVSPSAAAAALRGDGRLHSQTRARIIAVAEELGYRPNAVARTLRQSSGSVVATVLFDMPTGDSVNRPNSFWEQAIFSYVQELAQANVGNVFVPAPQAEMLNDLPADVVVVFNLPPDGSAADLPAPRGTPVIRVVEGTEVATPAPTGARPTEAARIVWNYEAALGEVLDHLAEAGASRPGLLLPPTPLMPTALIRQAHEEWCRMHERAVLISESPDVAAGVGDLLDLGCDGFVFHGGGDTDRAARVVDAVHSAGLAIPHDVLVATVTPGKGDPHMTSVVYDGWASGVGVAHAVLEGLRTGTFPDAVFTWELWVGESTGG